MRSWHFLGGPSSWTYRLFDALRNRLNRRLSRFLGNEAVWRSDSVVLEAGSGPGYASSLLSKHAKVRISIALDIDPGALRVARRRDPSLSVVLGDVNQLPFCSGTCDLVWSSSTLEHLASPAQVLYEMQRVTREDGAIFVGVPYRYGVLGFQSWIRSTKIGIWIGDVFDRSQLVHMMVEQELGPERIDTYGLTCFIGILARKRARSTSGQASPARLAAEGRTSRSPAGAQS